MFPLKFISYKENLGEVPLFKTRKLKKNNPIFLADYNKTEYTWMILRNISNDLPEINSGVIRSPSNYLNEPLNNTTLLEVLNNYRHFVNGDLINGDNLKIKKSYIFDSISNIPRKSEDEYLSFIYTDSIWVAGYKPHSEEIKLIDEGYIEFTAF